MTRLTDNELEALLGDLATDRVERTFNEKRRHHDMPFDIWPRPSAKLGDLSRTFFEEEYLPGAIAPEMLAANERSYEQRLSACRMIVAEESGRSAKRLGEKSLTFSGWFMKRIVQRVGALHCPTKERQIQ